MTNIIEHFGEGGPNPLASSDAFPTSTPSEMSQLIAWTPPAELAGGVGRARTRVRASILARARYLGFGPEDLRELGGYASSYEDALSRGARAHRDGDRKAAKHGIHRFLTSFAAKVCAVVLTTKVKHGEQPPTMAEIKALAGTLNPFQPIPEAVYVWWKLKPGGGKRLVVSFGPKRRALQKMCADILSIWYPASPFDYAAKGKGGVSAALNALQEIMDRGGYTCVVIIDAANCYGSAIKKKVGGLTPLPEAVAYNVMLIQEDVEVLSKPTNGTNGAPLQPHPSQLDSLEADEAARQGLPQGSSTSGIIMYWAAIGPLLGTLPFANRIVLWGDDLAVPVKDVQEGEAVQKLIKSLYATSPVGPLTIGSTTIRHEQHGFDFLGYRVVRKPAWWGGQLRYRPSDRSYRKWELKCEKKYRDAGGGIAGWKQVFLYQKRWIASFPLWKANSQSKLYLWYTLRACSWHKPKIAGQGP